MNGWEKNETWQKDVWLMVLTFFLVLSILVGFIGWIRYRDAVRAKNEQDVMIGNFYKTIE